MYVFHAEHGYEIKCSLFDFHRTLEAANKGYARANFLPVPPEEWCPETKVCVVENDVRAEEWERRGVRPVFHHHDALVKVFLRSEVE